jgi:hypothetical protein
VPEALGGQSRREAFRRLSQLREGQDTATRAVDQCRRIAARAASGQQEVR